MISLPFQEKEKKKKLKKKRAKEARERREAEEQAAAAAAARDEKNDDAAEPAAEALLNGDADAVFLKNGGECGVGLWRGCARPENVRRRLEQRKTELYNRNKKSIEM